MNDRTFTFEEIIEKEGRLVYMNVGRSMLPWICEGRDIVIIEKLPDILKKYDCVLFVRPKIKGRGRYVLHRIIKIYDDGTYYIMGDNTICGEKINKENIIGILTCIKQPERIIQMDDIRYRAKVWGWWHIVHPGLYMYRVIRQYIYRILIKRG